MNNENTLRMAIAKYGMDAQLGMVSEECGELIVAVNKYLRSKSPEAKERLVEEVADVEIMLDQMRIIFDESEINFHKQKKVNRLEQRMKP